MAHGLNAVIKSEIECNNKPRNIPPELGGHPPQQRQQEAPKMGSRRIFTPQFKLQVLESYRVDADCKGNQRATARKFNIHRRQIQKWLQVEQSLVAQVANSTTQHHHNHGKMSIFNNNNSEMRSHFDAARHRVVVGSGAVNVIKSTHSALTTTRVSTTATTSKLGKSNTQFISPVHSYACNQPVSLAPPLYEFNSSPSVSLSALPNSTHTTTLVPTNTSLLYDRKCSNGGISHLPSPSFQNNFQTSPTSGFTPYQPPTEPHIPYVPVFEYSPPYYPIRVSPVLIPETPIDLSLPIRRDETPPYPAKLVIHHHQQVPKTPPSDAVDLRKRKRDEDDEAISCSPPPPKQKKLFKPYLLDDDEQSSVKKNSDSIDDVPDHRQEDAVIWKRPICEYTYEVPSPAFYPLHSPVSGYESSTSSMSSEYEPHYTIDFKVSEPYFYETRLVPEFVQVN